MIEALAAIGSVGVVGLAAALVMLAFKALRAKDELVACLALLRDEQKLADEYKSQRDISVVNEGVTASKLLQETTLRKSVEDRLAESEKHTRAYLSFALANAGQNEVDEIVAGLFRRNPAAPVLPQPKAATAPSRTDPDALLDPDA